MAAIDDILGGSGSPQPRKKPVTTSIEVSLQGAPTTVGDQPTGQAEGQDTKSPVEGQDTGQAAQTEIQQPSSVENEEKPQMSYVDLYKALNPYKPESDEEKAKRLKRERAEATLAAVGDGISALSNIWFASRYAPSINPSQNMSATTKDRWEKLRHLRESNSKAYFDGYIRAKAMDEAKDKENRNWRHTIEREKIADQRADAKEELARKKAEQDELMFQARYALQLGKLTEQGYRNAIAEVKAGRINEITDAEINRLNRSGSGGGGYGGGNGKKGPYLHLEDDDPIYFDTVADYERAVMRAAKEYGIPIETEVITERDFRGRPKKSRTVKRSTKEIAAEVEAEATKRRESKRKKLPNPMGNDDVPAKDKKLPNPMG